MKTSLKRGEIYNFIHENIGEMSKEKKKELSNLLKELCLLHDTNSAIAKEESYIEQIKTLTDKINKYKEIITKQFSLLDKLKK